MAGFLLRLRGVHGVKATRVDCAFDDFERVIEVADLWERYAEPRLFGPGRHRHHQEGDGKGGRQGNTIYFGEREGGRVVCVYDKAAESDGEINAVRYEARFFKAHADAVWDKLLGVYTGAELVRRIGELVAGSIDFYQDRALHVERRRRAPFWETIRGWLRRGGGEGLPEGGGGA